MLLGRWRFAFVAIFVAISVVIFAVIFAVTFSMILQVTLPMPSPPQMHPPMVWRAKGNEILKRVFSAFAYWNFMMNLSPAGLIAGFTFSIGVGTFSLIS